jgi:hypothetical protein
MCPACLATTAMLIASAVSTGGVAAVLANKLLALSGMSLANSSVEKANQKEEIWEKQRTSK